MTLALAFDIVGNDRASSALGKVADAADDTGDRLKGIGDKAKAGFAIVSSAALAGAAVIGKGFFDALGQEAQNDKLAAQLGLSPEQSAAFGRAAGDLYAQAYGDSIGQVNEALGAVSSTFGDQLGPAEDALSTTTAKALNLASAFDLDVGDAVNRAGQLLKQGLVSDTDEAFDLVTAAMQKMPPAIRDELGEATTEYSRFFSGLGISGQEMFDLFAQADDKFALDKTGDAIKELSIRATDMSASSVAAYKAAGLDAEDMAGKILAGGDTAREGLTEIIDGLRDIKDPVKQANAAIGLFGTPLEDLGTEQIPGFLDQLANMGTGLGDVEGAADRMGDTLSDNASTKIESFKRSALQGLTEFLGGTAIPAVEGFMTLFQEEGLGGVIDRAGEMWQEAWPGIQDWLGETLTALGTWITEVGGPAAIEGLGNLLGAALEWVTEEGLPLLGEGMRELVPALVEWITEDAIPKIAEELPGILETIGTWILEDGVPALLGFGGDLALALLDGIGQLLESGGEFAIGVAKDIGNALIGLINEHVIGGINDALEFSFDPPGPLGKISIDPKDIPDIPKFHDGGIFNSGRGEGLALLRDGEGVFTPGQMASMGDLHLHVAQLPGENQVDAGMRALRHHRNIRMMASA